MPRARSRAVRILLHLLCALALSATSLSATEETTKTATKKRGGFTGEKPTATDEGEPVTKPFATPSPARKKKVPVTAGKSTPAPTKKKTSPAQDDAKDIPAVPEKKKSPDEETPSKPTPAEPPKKEHAPAATLEPSELTEFNDQPPRVQQLLTAALALTKLNLTYTYGSADPAQGGMDCSGTIYHLLREQGFKDVPRDSSSQYIWARKTGKFFAVVSNKAESFEFRELLPGDLMFWTGTYATGRDVPISHVMLYLGHEKRTGQRVMFGASDGRSYAGVQRWGVSVFDFKMPKTDPATPERRVDFVGYARIPALRESAAESPAPPAIEAPAKIPDSPPTTPKPPAKRKRKSG